MGGSRLLLLARASQKWDWWNCGPSQYENLAVTFASPAKIAADYRWLPVKISYHKLRLPTKNVCKCLKRPLNVQKNIYIIKINRWKCASMCFFLTRFWRNHFAASFGEVPANFQFCGAMLLVLVTCDSWQVTFNTWHGTCDTWHVTEYLKKGKKKKIYWIFVHVLIPAQVGRFSVSHMQDFYNMF